MSKNRRISIEIEEKRISRQVSVPSRVCFQLNPQDIAAIESIIEGKDILQLSHRQLTNLRYYGLINFYLPEKDNGLEDTNYLSFNSSYILPGQKLSQTIMRSEIHLTGQIRQEIQRDLWQNPPLAIAIAKIHHCLTGEILRQLFLPQQNKFLIFCLWLLPAIIIAIALSLIIYSSISKYFLFILLINLGSWIFLAAISKYFLQKHFKNTILTSLINGYLAKNTFRRNLGFQLLSFFA